MTNHPFCCHTTVTLLSHPPSSTTTPPHRAKFAVTLLSHCCHTTITEAISSPKINFFPEESAHPLENLPCFLENLPHFPEKVRCFSEKMGHHRGKHSPRLRSPVTDVTEKNTKLLVYTRAHARVEIKAIIYRVRPSSIARFSPANMEGNEVVDVRPTTNGID